MSCPISLSFFRIGAPLNMTVPEETCNKEYFTIEKSPTFKATIQVCLNRLPAFPAKVSKLLEVSHMKSQNVRHHKDNISYR